MTVKIKNITLEYTINPDGFYGAERRMQCNKHGVPFEPCCYRVVSIVDSVDYTPGQILHVNEVRTLCASREWKVTTKAMS